MQEKETLHSPNMSKDVWKHSTPRSPEVGDFQRCNNADIDWYMGMPTDQLPVDPKVERLPALCEEDSATLEPTFPMIAVSFHIQMGMFVCWNKSNTLPVHQIQNVAG